METNRRGFLQWTGVGLASVVAAFTPNVAKAFVVDDKPVEKVVEPDYGKEERLLKCKHFNLKFEVVHRYDFPHDMLRGMATPFNKLMKPKYFACQVDSEEFNKDEYYKNKVLKEVVANMEMAYKKSYKIL
jgi:hypothetical protein